MDHEAALQVEPGAIGAIALAVRESPSSRFLNRELSWLDFNERVLALAERPSLPLLERTKFLAIFSGNLDEFFQVRVGGLKAQIEAGLQCARPGGQSARAPARAGGGRVGP